MNFNLTPGTLVVIKRNALVQRFGTETEFFLPSATTAMVVQLSHLWHELGTIAEPSPSYLVLFAGETRLYIVPGDMIMTPDQATDPSRLFGWLRG